MARTKNYAIQGAVSFQKQLGTVAADLYGGANDVTLGAGHLKFFSDPITIDDGIESIEDTAINGTQISNDSENISAVPTVEMPFNIHGNGDLDLLVTAFGWEALDGPKANATNNTHMIPLQIRGREQREYTAAEQALITVGFDTDDRINTYTHVGLDLGPSTLHAKNVVIKGFEIGSTQKQELKAKLTGTAEKLTRDAAKTGVANWAKIVGAYASTFKHYNAVFSVGPVSGTLVATQVTEFMIKVNHGLAEGIIPTGTSNGGLAQAEPMSDGLSEVTLDFKVYKHDSDLYKTWQINKTAIFAKMEYTRGSEFLGFYIPLMKVVTAQPDPADGGSVQVSCKLYLPAAADPFTTERTVVATEWTLPFVTPLYCIAREASASNFMRVL
jgi:hypothetical protein